MKKINKKQGENSPNTSKKGHFPSNPNQKRKEYLHGNSRKRSEHRSELDMDLTPQRKRRDFNSSEEKPRFERRERKSYGNSQENRFEKRRDFNSSEEKPRFEKRERFGKKGEDTPKTPNYDMERIRQIEKKREETGKKRHRHEETSAKQDGLIRLNKYIANSGVCSRREADELILAGKIKVNGETVTELGHKINPRDTVEYSGKTLKREKLVYVLLNKPKDHITTVHDPEGRKTVMNLVQEACEERIFPVGRLDRNTTGLLLLTNDGDLAERLMHPSNQIKKEYKVILDRILKPEDELLLMGGVELEDGKSRFDKLHRTTDETTFVVQLHSGKNRIVRRMFEHLNYEVVGLDRIGYAGLDKKIYNAANGVI